MYEATKIADFGSRLEAQSAGRTLESEGIPFLIKSGPATPEVPQSSATIYVPPDIARRAREVLGIENEPIN